MARRLVDISSPLKAGIKSDPPHMLPQIEYRDHHDTAPAMAEYMGVRVDQFPRQRVAPHCVDREVAPRRGLGVGEGGLGQDGEAAVSRARL